MEEVVLLQQIKELKERNETLQEGFDTMYRNFNSLFETLEYWKKQTEILRSKQNENG